jgi:hypothetical protein
VDCGVRLTAHWHVLSLNIPLIFYAAASIANGVGTEGFAVPAREGQIAL